jgi:hypothetical protein
MNSGRKLRTDQSHWRPRLETYKPGEAKETDEVIETKDGDLTRVTTSSKCLTISPWRRA